MAEKLAFPVACFVVTTVAIAMHEQLTVGWVFAAAGVLVSTFGITLKSICRK